ncbi:hypothetical protein [Paraburkholderia oxyphila]|uniref:hypothetical protein n=1 Tax=Paraburkholderia oxyphila TaxID=614212 RepID=UPI00048176CD|nr:hypothetical protein [Paraburkholderia oxyphila]
MKLYLIGTAHSFQKRLRCAPSACSDEFKNFVVYAAVCHSVRTIGEELSKSVLGTDVISLCAEVAGELSISHLYCDPDNAERVAAGLPVEDCPSTWGPREEEWLARLDINEFPVLFVCGANHVDSFAEKCRARGIAVEVLKHDWEPSVSVDGNTII